jgi:adenylosuccinate synthase
MSYQKCPVCDGKGYTSAAFGSCPTCTVCEGKKIISELTGRPPKSLDKTLISNGREYNIVDPAKIAEANKKIAEQMQIARNKYLAAVQKQNQSLSEYRTSIDKKFEYMHDVPADIQNIIDNNFKDLIE